MNHCLVFDTTISYYLHIYHPNVVSDLSHLDYINSFSPGSLLPLWPLKVHSPPVRRSLLGKKCGHDALPQKPYVKAFLFSLSLTKPARPDMIYQLTDRSVESLGAFLISADLPDHNYFAASPPPIPATPASLPFLWLTTRAPT